MASDQVDTEDTVGPSLNHEQPVRNATFSTCSTQSNSDAILPLYNGKSAMDATSSLFHKQTDKEAILSQNQEQPNMDATSTFHHTPPDKDAIFNQYHEVKVEYDKDPAQHSCNPGEAPDSFTCGSCGGLYSTICSLHEHIQSHSFGGSYHYDHRSRTAFPKFDSQCSATQTDVMVVELVGKQPLSAPNTVTKSATKYVSLLNSDQKSAYKQKKVRLQKANYDSGDALDVVKHEDKMQSTMPGSSVQEQQVLNPEREQAEIKPSKASNNRKRKQIAGSVKTISRTAKKIKIQKSDSVKKTSRSPRVNRVKKEDVHQNVDDVSSGSLKEEKLMGDSVEISISKYVKMKTVQLCDIKQDNVLKYSCVKCKLVFSKEEYLASHMKKHDGSLICDCCSDEFSSLDDLKGHLFEDDRVKALQAYVCPICNLAITELRGIKAHYCISADDLIHQRQTVRLYPSSTLKAVKNDKHTLIHRYVPLYKEEVNERNVQCQQCLSWFENEYFLTLHSVVHRYSHKCSKCIFHFLSDIDLGLHQLECGNNVACEICGKGFPSRRKLYGHRDVHKKTRDVVCDYCGRTFKTKHDLQKHLRTTSSCPGRASERKFKCELCGSSFYERRTLKTHMLRHSDVRKFTCEICGAMFKVVSSLNLHIKRHNEDRPTLKCEICGASFKEDSSLKRHRKIHTKQFNHSCEYCGKQFVEKWNLQAHVRQHTGDKPYKCEKCGMGFTHNVSRKAHMAKCV